MKKLSVLLFILFSNSLMATTESSLDQSIGASYLPNEMWLKVFSHMNLKSLSNSAQVSTSFKTFSYRTFEDPQFIDQLSDEEIILIGFNKSDQLRKVTKIKLEMLPKLQTNKAIHVWFQVWTQAWGQAAIQVSGQVRDQVRDQIGDQARDQIVTGIVTRVCDQIGAQVGSQVWAQFAGITMAQTMAQIEAQIKALVGNQVEALVGNQVEALVREQIRSILPFYPHLGSSEEDRNNFKKHLIPLIDGCISIYHYFFVKKLLEPSEDGSGTIFETIVDQFGDEDHINLDAVYNVATPDGWEEMNPNIKNFLYPFQRYSHPSEKGILGEIDFKEE